jgi:hypothetical protein
MLAVLRLPLLTLGVLLAPAAVAEVKVTVMSDTMPFCD